MTSVLADFVDAAFDPPSSVSPAAASSSRDLALRESLRISNAISLPTTRRTWRWACERGGARKSVVGVVWLRDGGVSGVNGCE